MDNPEDFVRLEVRAALSRGVRVVPILVDGATMPSADQLPEELAPLTRRQAVEINPIGFNTDRLLATLAATFAASAAAAAVDEPLASDQVAPVLPPVADLPQLQPRHCDDRLSGQVEGLAREPLRVGGPRIGTRQGR